MCCNKISFITCVNNEFKYKKMLKHIDELYLPDGYEIDIVRIDDAKSMCSGYNIGMSKAQGDIKVYLHEDVYILNKDFIGTLISLFADKSIGMIGLAGSKDIPSNGKYSASKNKFGLIIHYMVPGIQEEWKHGNFDDVSEDVLCVDGLLIATQYDIFWREELFESWHFYDISQSIEFNKNKYRVVVPKMEKSWCIHDCGKSNYRRYKGYEEQRKIFVSEYNEYLQG